MNELIKKLEQERDALVERLDRGAVRIEEARAKGKDVQSWEDYWIGLLREYEEICAKLSGLHKAEVQKAQHQHEMMQQR